MSIINKKKSNCQSNIIGLILKVQRSIWQKIPLNIALCIGENLSLKMNGSKVVQGGWKLAQSTNQAAEKKMKKKWLYTYKLKRILVWFSIARLPVDPLSDSDFSAFNKNRSYHPILVCIFVPLLLLLPLLFLLQLARLLLSIVFESCCSSSIHFEQSFLKKTTHQTKAQSSSSFFPSFFPALRFYSTMTLTP